MTKIKNIGQLVQHDDLMFTSWLESQGVSRAEISQYVKSGWLERIAQGVYKFAGANPTIYSAISSYNSQLSKCCYVGAETALGLWGYYHYVPMGRPQVFIFSPREERLPKWLQNYDWGVYLRYATTSIFGTYLIEDAEIDGHKLSISSPERAFLECIYMCPKYISQMDAYYILESLTTLRPKELQKLLETCTSVKVKRLFLYMAEKAGHQWFKRLDISKIRLGSGPRSIERGGVYERVYSITVSKELKQYE